MQDYYRSRLSPRPRSRSRLRLNRQKINVILLSKLTRFLFFGLIAGIFLLFALFLWYGRDLPTPGKLSANNLSQSTKIYDRDGEVLYDIYETQNRTYVELSKVSKTLQEATVAIEDKDFYENQGFSIAGYLRSLRNLFLYREIEGGGSTLTQQLVKNALLSSEQTLPRKIKELILAIQVDQKYTKNQILELYLNIVPFGGTAVGIEAASELYFGKKAKDLNLVESAILAGMPQRPTYYSPYGQYPKAYIDRATNVLRRMREDGYITKQEEEKAVAALPKVKFKPQKSSSIRAPHFSFYVKDLLVEKFGEAMVERGGLRVTTTLDYDLQEKAEDIVNEEIEKAASLKVGNGATIVVDPRNGEILSMVGSKDFFEESEDDNPVSGGQFNVITDGLRQPGSSIKPITYAVALEKGYTASSVLMDTKTTFHNPGEKDYEPVNYDGKYHGPVQMRFALGSSLNIPAVKMVGLIGVKEMLTLANDLGLYTLAPTDENLKKFGLSVTLGGGDVHPIDMAGAYSAFANGGYKVDPIAILKVTDSKGKVLFEEKETKDKKRVLSEEVAFIISHMLLDNNARLITFGVNSYLNMGGRHVAVKTGTTDDKRDNWTIGWTPNVLVVTWVGNNDNSPMGNVASGVTGAAPIWRRVILEAMKGRPNEEFKKPDNVIAANVDALGGGLPIDGQPTRSEYYIKGTEPTAPSLIYQKVKVSKHQENKLANQEEIDRNDYDTKEYIVFKENDPVSGDGVNRWQEGINKWLEENHKDDQKYKPPTETSDHKYSDDKKNENTPTPTPK